MLDSITRGPFTHGTCKPEDTERCPAMNESDINAAPSSIETNPVKKAARAMSSDSPT
jgi:hypothetical protein